LAAPDPADTSLSISTSQHRYRGRFAPSPTGPLHTGSIVAALASYLDARAARGTWLVRMEDLDPPREQPGAADDILRTLDVLGLHWDETVVYQSTRLDAYQAALDNLKQQGLIFSCQCSRLDLGGSQVYPGTCRQRIPRADTATALRCRVPDQTFGFEDRLQGPFSQQLANEVGDFILLRKEGYFAYQLAVVVDDDWQNVTDVVRGMDLLDSTPRQLYLQQKPPAKTAGAATALCAHSSDHQCTGTKAGKTAAFGGRRFEKPWSNAARRAWVPATGNRSFHRR
jgi:glutamyl-Q tRNA(Asp) synthetase